MKRIALLLVAVFLVSTVSTRAANAAIDVAAYPLRSLASWEFSVRYSALYPKKPTAEAFDASLTPLSAPVRYTGHWRALSPEKKTFLAHLARDVVKNPDLVTMYQKEIEVTESGLSYWIAVQENVFPHFARELKVGAPMKIYAHFAGIAQKLQPVYLMVEFDSPVASNAVPRPER